MKNNDQGLDCHSELADKKNAPVVDAGNRGVAARVVARLRKKIRQLFKKDDPNIYPFY